MRFSTFLPALALISSVLAGSNNQAGTPTPTKPQPVSPRSEFEKRQAVLDVNGCITVNASTSVNVITPNVIQIVTTGGGLVGGILQPIVNTVNFVANTLNTTTSIGVRERLCLCLNAGAISPQSLAQLGAILQNDAGVNLGLFGNDLGVASRLVANALVVLLGRPTGSAACPAGAFPTNPASNFTFNTSPQTCSTCEYTCVGNTPVRCNGECIATGAPCSTSVPGTGGRRGTQRRGMRYTNPDLLCASGLTACGLPNKVATLWGKVECLDVQNNVDTCGGCEFPLPGRPKGIDCGAIENASTVNCVQGKCIIESCIRGFNIVGDACVQV